MVNLSFSCPFYHGEKSQKFTCKISPLQENKSLCRERSNNSESEPDTALHMKAKEEGFKPAKNKLNTEWERVKDSPQTGSKRELTKS